MAAEKSNAERMGGPEMIKERDHMVQGQMGGEASESHQSEQSQSGGRQQGEQGGSRQQGGGPQRPSQRE